MERTRGWSIPATVSGGGGLEQLVDHLHRGGLRDLRERADLEDLLEPILRGFALVALPRHYAEQVPALAFGHRLGRAVAGGAPRGPGPAIAARARRRGFIPRTARGRGGGGTRSGGGGGGGGPLAVAPGGAGPPPLPRGRAGGASFLAGREDGGGGAPGPGREAWSRLTSSNSSEETTPQLTASRRARALARVSDTRIRCGTRKASTLPGSASPRPSKWPRSVSTAALTMASRPFSSLG